VEELLESARNSEEGGQKGQKGNKKVDAKKKAKGGEYQEWAGESWGGESWVGGTEWKQDEWLTEDWQPKGWNGYMGAQDWPNEEGDWDEDAWGESWDDNAVWGEDQSEWDEYIHVKDSIVRVDLHEAELGDADLKALMKHLDTFLQNYTKIHGSYILNIDLSCNSYISDAGVADHLAKFLNKWPVCHRLKLYKNSIGDHAIKALAGWVAEGHVHELHLSDLMGKVTGEAVFHLFKEIYRKGKYPFTNGNRGAKTPLWLRLEHNGIQQVDELINKGKAAGMNLHILDRADVAQVQRGGGIAKLANQKGQKGAKEDVPAVYLVLFRHQDKRSPRGRGGAANRGDLESPGPAVGSAPVGSGKSSGKGYDDDEEKRPSLQGGKGAELGKLWDPSANSRPQRNNQKQKLDLADLQMGCASYRPTQRSSPAGAPMPAYNQQAQQQPNQKGKQKQMDFNSSTAFPSLGGSGFPSLGGTSEPVDPGGIWGNANLQAAVAWGSAPSAVFDGKAREVPKAKSVPSPPLGANPPPTSQTWMPGLPPPVGANSAAWPVAGGGEGNLAVGGLPPPAGVWGPSSGTTSASPPPMSLPSPEVEATTSPPNEVANDVEPTITSPPPEEAKFEWRPLSFAEKNLLKVKKKLRDIEKIEELMASGEVEGREQPSCQGAEEGTIGAGTCDTRTAKSITRRSHLAGARKG